MKDPIKDETKTQEAVAAVLDIRSLVQRCLQLEEELTAQAAQIQALEETARQNKQETEQVKALARAGQTAMEQKKATILTRLRIIVQAAGDPQRLQDMEGLLADEALTPEEVERWYQRIEQEFRSLYPTQPLSQPSQDFTHKTTNPDWTMFRFGAD